MSLMRNLSRGMQKQDLQAKSQYSYGSMNSGNTYCFYGLNGKSTLSLAQLPDDNLPILVISMGGCSAHLAEEYPNAVFKTAKSLDELETILVDLEENFKLFANVAKWAFTEETSKKFLKDVFLPNLYKGNEQEGTEDYNYIKNLILEDSFIFSRIVIEEVDIVTSWIYDKVAKQFDTEIIGQDKANRGMDWNVLSKETISYFTRWLRLPCVKILATSERLPSESQALTEITPNLAKGSSNRLLMSLIGNVHYIGNDKGKYEIYIKNSPKKIIRNKFIPLLADIDKLPEAIDITNNPLAFWQFVKDCKEHKIPMLKVK